MSRRASGVPQTPIHNDDALERSLRRQQSSTRGSESLSDVARRVQDSPLNRSIDKTRKSPNSGAGTASPGTQVAMGDFQEWMKMVRMKRVKANNAFAIQLIDAFHSMVQGHILSQDGQNVTFQEATHTLGGCLTVYKNRIARVKDDTSKLLVGISDNKPSADDRADSDSNEASSDEDDETNAAKAEKRRKKQKQKKALGMDAFLAPAAKLEIDTNELATSIDPLLRKMSADFDKRGAGALLQYSLKLDKQGRLLLDAEAQELDTQRPEMPTQARNQRKASQGGVSRLPQIVEDEEGDEGEEEQNRASISWQSEQAGMPTIDSNENLLAEFNLNYFANLDIGHREALPMIDGIAKAVANPLEGTESLIHDMQAWALTDPGSLSTYREDEDDGAFEAQTEVDDGEAVGLELAAEGDYGNVSFDDPAADEELEDDGHAEDLSLNSIINSRLPSSGNWMDLEYLQGLDTQSTNWAGPSFWKIRRLHARVGDQADEGSSAVVAKECKDSRRRMASAVTMIDFTQEEEVNIQELFHPGSRSRTLNSKQYNLQDKHLLPVDMHFTIKQLVGLRLRPLTGMAPAFRSRMWQGAHSDIANESATRDEFGMESLEFGNEDAAPVSNDEDYFYGGWGDSPEAAAMRPQTASEMFSQATRAGYGTQANQLNFARTAKRIDVRRLKDNVWNAIQTQTEQHSQTAEAEKTAEKKVPTLIQIIQETQPSYSDQQRSDLSPAMYFISLLHLSNEKGLTLENTDAFTDIRITVNN